MSVETDIKLAIYNTVGDRSLETLRSVFTFAVETIKAAMLINGGGAIALLAFASHIWSSNSGSSLVQPLSYAVCWFAGGVLVATIAAAIGYLTQYKYLRALESHLLELEADLKFSHPRPFDYEQFVDDLKQDSKRSRAAAVFRQTIAWIAIVFSVGCFCLGAGTAYRAFTISQSPTDTNSPDSAAALATCVPRTFSDPLIFPETPPCSSLRQAPSVQSQRTSPIHG